MFAHRVGVALIVAAVAVVAPMAAVQADGNSFDLLTATNDGNEYPLRWNPCQSEITFQINVDQARQAGVSVKKAKVRAVAEIKVAFQRVGDETGLNFTYTGRSPEVPDGSDWYEEQAADSEIVVAYVKQGSSDASSLLTGGSWGTGGQVYRTTPGKLVVGRGFVVLDASKTRRMKPGFGSGNVRGNLVLHELGHVMGLDHVDNPNQLMNPTLTERSPNGYAAGDRKGLSKLGAGPGCIAGAEEAWDGS